MGCYGLGVSRLMGAIAEVTADDRGLVWPPAMAPFPPPLITLGNDNDPAIDTQVRGIYELLTKAGIEALWDDRKVAPGVKLADADLLGLPFRLVVSGRTAEKGLVEVKRRLVDKVDLIAPQNLCASLG